MAFGFRSVREEYENANSGLDLRLGRVSRPPRFHIRGASWRNKAPVVGSCYRDLDVFVCVWVSISILRDRQVERRALALDRRHQKTLCLGHLYCLEVLSALM